MRAVVLQAQDDAPAGLIDDWAAQRGNTLEIARADRGELTEREIVWVSRIPPGPWLTWHEDGIELPPLAYEPARNRFGVQAFCHCRHLAVQFHPEVTPGSSTASPRARA